MRRGEGKLWSAGCWITFCISSRVTVWGRSVTLLGMSCEFQDTFSTTDFDETWSLYVKLRL